MNAPWPRLTMSTAATIAKALEGRPAAGSGYICRCPVPGHGKCRGDRNPSLLVRDRDFRLDVHCFAGCALEEVIGELQRRGLIESPARSFDKAKQNGAAAHSTTRRLLAAYNYEDEGGDLQFQVLRFAPKDFRQRRPDGEGSWTWSVQGVRLVPYRLPELIEAIATEHPIFVVEGEKDVDAMRAIGVPATCNPGGASKWPDEFAKYFAGADVIVIPDNDEPGRKHSERVVASLITTAAQIRLLELPSLPPGGDVSDWLADGGTVEGLWKLVEATPPRPTLEAGAGSNGNDTNQHNPTAGDPIIRSAAELQTMVFAPLKFIVPELIVEGCVLLAGRPKVRKSWLALDVALAVAGAHYCLGDRKCDKGSVLHLALEDGDRRMKSRMTKLLQAVGGNWPEKFEYATRWPRADEGGIEKIEKWCDERSDARLVVIDVLARFRPLTRGKNNAYEQDYAALSKLQELATRRSITILVVHHTRKGASDDPVEEISGTLGLAGAADAFLVLKKAATGTTLVGRCRDTEDVDLAVQFSGETCRWTILGKASEVHQSDERKRVLAALEDAGAPMSPKDIILATGMKRNAVDLLLFKMVRTQDVVKIKRGLYCLPTYAPRDLRNE